MRAIAVIVTALALLVLTACFSGGMAAPAESAGVKAYVFWQSGCPYCAAARRELDALAGQMPVSPVPLELDRSRQTDALFLRAIAFFDLAPPAVPLVVIGDKAFLGYLDRDRSARLYRDAVTRCLETSCPDVVADLSRTLADDAVEVPAAPRSAAATPALLPEMVRLPWIGEVPTADLSLPALTVVLGAIDGFNPCAMWVLVFLIGLLLGLKDERRMWLLGGAFLLATAGMYFAVMVAWLNLVLFLGAVVWVRAAIGVLALAGGLLYLREYWRNPDATCRVTNASRRQRIMAAFRSAVEKRQLALAVAGIVALAVMVNFIELLCSAGIPAVYTQILTLSDLSRPAYYGYVALYILVFMLDDIAVFVTAMVALKVTGLTGAYARISHLVGGIVLLVIGALMLLRPDLLTFS